MSKKSILFFDGYCNLCDNAVSFLMRRNSKLGYFYASLQGESAQNMLPKDALSLDSVVLLKEGEVFKKSRAAFEVIKDLGGFWSVLLIFSWLPTFLTDWGYMLVSKSRYQVFGKKDQCRLPTAEESRFFLP